MGRKTGTASPTKQLSRWIRSRSVREKVTLGVIAGVLMLFFLKYFVRNENYFFIAAQIAHAAGIFVLIWKLSISKTCAGLSLKTQELTAIYLTVRIISIMFFREIHVVLDLLTLVATLWVIYMMRFKLQSTYMKELDNMSLLYVLVPCAIVAFIGHPQIPFQFFFKFMWSFCNTIEAVSVLPQLRLMQNAKMVEPFTSHYVFALGVARFFDAASWIIQLIVTKGAHFYLVGQGHIWIAVALLCEFVQTFILADFCYYYVKSAMDGQIVMSLPSQV